MRSLLSSPSVLLAAALFSTLRQHVCASAAFPVDVDDLDPLKTCKRREVRLIESDNKLYMYGGQSWVRNGTETPFQVTNNYLRIADFTKARDLGDPASITAKILPGNITIFQHGAFWADSKKLYVVGGEVNDEPWLSPDGEFLPSNYTAFKGNTIFSYEMAADAWKSEPALQPDNGHDVTDSICYGAFAYNPATSKAYFYSGNNGAGARSLDPSSTPIYVGRTNEEVTGNGNLLTFDTESFKWSNDTTNQRLTTTGTDGSEMAFLPGTEGSSGGLAVVIGGQRRGDAFESMRKVLVLDSGTGTWYGQATTADGDYPPGRYNFCIVGASAADNSSHNIYMYGGESDTSKPQAYSDMWILSVPSFRWIRVDTDSPARKSQGCATVGDRYMVTYGGVPSGYGEEGDADPCDDDNYGMRLFDMTTLNWTTKYEGPSQANKNAYTVPKAVYNVVGGNEKGGATKTAPAAGFETPALASLFQKSNPTSSRGPSPPSGTNQGSTNTATPPKKSSNLGPILGGVLGGLAALALILVGVLLLLKRRKNRNPYATTETARPHFENPGELPAGELPAHGNEAKNIHEVYSGEALQPQELDAGPNTAVPMKYAHVGR